MIIKILNFYRKCSYQKLILKKQSCQPGNDHSFTLCHSNQHANHCANLSRGQYNLLFIS